MQEPRHPRRRRALRLAISGALLAPVSLTSACSEPEPAHTNPGPVEGEAEGSGESGEQPTVNPGPEDELEEEPHVNTGPEDEPHVNPGPEDDLEEDEPVAPDEDVPPPTANPGPDRDPTDDDDQ
ncbi:MAG: hypothetical protein R3F62_18155 [Planctomycetota bacterium]